MRRKVISHGPSSLGISLPSEWVKRFHINKGDEVEICEQDGKIEISTDAAIPEDMTLDVSFEDVHKETMKDLLMAFHKKGYDEIKIAIQDEDAVKEMYKFLNDQHLGYEIVRHEQQFIVLRSVSNPHADQFDNLFRRLFRVVIEYSDRIGKLLQDDTREITHTVLLHDTSIMRLSNYCKRIIIKDPRKEVALFNSIIEQFETMTKSLSAIRCFISSDDISSEIILPFYVDASDLLKQTYHLYYDFSLDGYTTIRHDLKDSAASVHTAMQEKTESIFMLEKINRMYDALESILSSILLMHH